MIPTKVAGEPYEGYSVGETIQERLYDMSLVQKKSQLAVTLRQWVLV